MLYTDPACKNGGACSGRHSADEPLTLFVFGRGAKIKMLKGLCQERKICIFAKREIIYAYINPQCCEG
ncbi:hypothetical protein HMPREF1146_1920 [Prevotella sp. MSX73]|nr:hypothetical protein HMPREF1146_1920 [Prevotella sp. MSX73]